MTPCSRLYAYLGRQLNKAYPNPSHAYMGWIQTYSSDSYHALPAAKEVLLNRLGKAADYGKLHATTYHPVTHHDVKTITLPDATSARTLCLFVRRMGMLCFSTLGGKWLGLPLLHGQVHRCKVGDFPSQSGGRAGCRGFNERGGH